MKILFVTRDKFPPFRPAAAAIFLVELPARGHSVYWLAQSAVPQTAGVMALENGKAFLGASSAGNGMLATIKRNAQGFVNYLRIFRILKQEKYDLVQVKDLYFPAVIALIACKYRRVPFCYWLAYPHAESSIYKAKERMTRHLIYYYLRGQVWRFLLYKIILPSADHIFAQSEQMKKDLAQQGAEVDRITPVPGSLDLRDIPYTSEPQSQSDGDSPGRLDIVYLGTLSRVRHLDFLLRAFAKVAQEVSHVHLVLLGKGDEPADDAYLKSVASELGINDKTLFTGHLPIKQAWEYVRNAAVCVSPYFPTMILNSTSPTKLIEYMAMAKAVVGNDHPEQELVITQSGGGLCVPYNETKFAAAIVRILKDPELARNMGERGRTFVEKYRTNTVMADVVEAQYQRVCRLTANTDT